MPILFSVVARERKPIANYASCDGNFDEIIDKVLERIALDDSKQTYLHGQYLFHYVAENKHVYLCITDKLCQRSRAFLFLNEIKRRFSKSRGGEFSGTLAAEMHRYSEDCSAIVVRKGELEELNNIGVESSEVILGEKILYVKNTEKLSFSTISFVGESPQRISVYVRKSKSYILILIVVIIILVAFYIVSPVSCCQLIILVVCLKLFIK